MTINANTWKMLIIEAKAHKNKVHNPIANTPIIPKIIRNVIDTSNKNRFFIIKRFSLEKVLQTVYLEDFCVVQADRTLQLWQIVDSLLDLNQGPSRCYGHDALIKLS
jgi:hypothetical protein